MSRLRAYLRAYAGRKHVRPWSLAAPIIVLLIALPLLSPLRHPLRSQMSDEETARWGTVQALVEQQTFAIDGTSFAQTRQKVRIADVYYADQPPVQGLLLAGPYWVMVRCGLRFATNPGLVEYLLTVIGVTVPVAAAAGMLYRMGRVFEFRRPARAGLALACILGSGTISYATILNPYAPAAALVLGAAAILVQLARIGMPLRSGGFLIGAGFFTALATVIHPAAAVFLVGFACVIPFMQWRPSLRFGGVLMYGIGVVPPLLLHLSLSFPITGDWRLGVAPLAGPPVRLARLVLAARASPAKVNRTAPTASPATTVPIAPGSTTPARASAPPATGPDADDESIVEPPTAWQMTWFYVARLTGALVGVHGLLVHFPVIVFGVAGVASVMRRHWPGTTKALAVVTAVAAVVITMRYVLAPGDWRWAMFGVRWYTVFLPLLLFWAGAWCRRRHHPATWATAGVLLVFSTLVSLIGATDPMPRDGYEHYTPVAAARRLVVPEGR